MGGGCRHEDRSPARARPPLSNPRPPLLLSPRPRPCPAPPASLLRWVSGDRSSSFPKNSSNSNSGSSSGGEAPTPTNPPLFAPPPPDYPPAATDPPGSVLRLPPKTELTPAQVESVFGYPTDLAAQYTLGAVLGAGSFGVVRRAVHRATGAAYAVKSVAKVPRRGACTPRHLLKLRTEVDVMRQLGPSLDAVYLAAVFEDAGAVHLGEREGKRRERESGGWPLVEFNPRPRPPLSHKALPTLSLPTLPVPLPRTRSSHRTVRGRVPGGPHARRAGRARTLTRSARPRPGKSRPAA